jgi:coenzyme F420-reducing hydrogenase alpha subunit
MWPTQVGALNQGYSNRALTLNDFLARLHETASFFALSELQVLVITMSLEGLITTLIKEAWDFYQKYKDLKGAAPKLVAEVKSLHEKLIWTQRFIGGRMNMLTNTHEERLKESCEQSEKTLTEARKFVERLSSTIQRFRATLDIKELYKLATALRNHRDAIDSIVGEITMYVGGTHTRMP